MLINFFDSQPQQPYELKLYLALGWQINITSLNLAQLVKGF